jgi:hypothetical protein
MKVTICFNDVKVIVPCNLPQNKFNNNNNSTNLTLINSNSNDLLSQTQQFVQFASQFSSASTASVISGNNHQHHFHQQQQPTSLIDTNNQRLSSCFIDDLWKYNLKVSDIIESAVARYKKATNKVNIFFK